MFIPLNMAVMVLTHPHIRLYHAFALTVVGSKHDPPFKPFTALCGIYPNVFFGWERSVRWGRPAKPFPNQPHGPSVPNGTVSGHGAPIAKSHRSAGDAAAKSQPFTLDDT